MYITYRKFVLTLCLMALAIMPQTVLAAPTVETASNAPGIVFQVTYIADTQTYEVHLIPSVTPEEALTLTAQVTLKVPHSATDPFTVSSLTSTVPGTLWTLSSRVNAPAEDPTSDYLSFTIDFPEGNYAAFEWVAEQAIKAFEFQSATGCRGVVALMDDSDAFAQLPNSMSTNPGNQIDVLFMGDGNLYTGNVGEPADCDGRTEEQSYDLYLPIVVR